MFRVSREIEFCYGHRLLDYEGRCRYLHGHNARVRVVLEGAELDHRGMFWDFGEIKRRLNTWIDENLDHRLILHRLDPVVPFLRESGETMYLIDANPTAENIAQLIYQQAQAMGLPVVEVVLGETPHCQAVFSAAALGGPASAPATDGIHGELILPRNSGPVRARSNPSRG